MFNQKQFAQLAFLAEAGVEVTMLSMNRYKVSGFYKSDSVTVDFTEMTVTARYNETTEFTEDDDLAVVLSELNQTWQERSSWRFEQWREPAPEWARVQDLLEQE